MKKLICFLLAIVMTVSLAIPVFAEESEEPQYGTIKVEYSDARGTIENLDVMVFNGFIYTNVDSFCSRMGYVLEPGESMVDIRAFSDLWMDNAATLVLKFCINDTTVYYTPNCGISIEYTAPTPCIQNERGIWVPLSYTLNLLGGSRNIIGDVLVIQMPSPSILSVATVIAHNISLLSFDWVDDFGYDEKTVSKTDGASRVVTLFSGLLEFDGRAWSSFVDWDAFDKKFGKTLAAMMCTQSEAELKEYIEDVEGMLDVFSPKGAIGSSLHVQQAMIDSDVNAWAKICEEKLAQLKSGCGTLPQYKMAYQQYERATKKQDLFSAVGGNDFVYIQDGLAEAANALEWATRIGYGVTYLTEFQKRDDFQSTVLTDYFATRRKTEELADGTAQAIENYASSGLVEYSLRRFLEEHALEIFVDESGLDALMGVPANLLLLAWDIMSENIPFYSDGLKSVEAREISNYAQQVQTDAFLNLNDLLDSMRASPDSITYADAFQLAEYCYVYLKSCYIARSSAIESLKGISEEAQKKLQSKINVETDINRYIADYLAILGQADLDNSCFILGFLPKNNRELLETYSDADLVSIVQQYPEIDYENLVTDAYSDAFTDDYDCEYCFHIPQFNLYGDLAQQVNQTIYDRCYSILERDAYSCMDEYGYSELGKMLYCWGYQGDLASVVIETNASMWADTQYQVYSISTATGSEVSMDDFLAIYGMDRESFYDLVHSRLNQYWDEMRIHRDNVGNDFFNDRVTRTLADENIRKAVPFINPDGGLSFVANIYSLAAGDCYWHLINAEGSLETVYMECTKDHSKDNAAPTGDTLQYFIENCDRLYFTEADIQNFDLEMCLYARNAIFAKSGRKFQSQELQAYFAQYSWYVPSVDPEAFTNDMLNRRQLANVELVQNLELKLKEAQEIETLLASLDGEAEIYTRYLHTGGYESLLGADFNKNTLEVSSCLVDLDNDGTRELFLSLGTGNYGPRGMETCTFLLDIESNQVIEAANAYFGGGTMGGDYLVIRYDKEQQKHVLALDSHIRAGVDEHITSLQIRSGPNFSANMDISRHYFNLAVSWTHEYADQIRSETNLYHEDGSDFYSYQINEQYVAKDVFDSAWERFEEPSESFQPKAGSFIKPIA